MEGAEEVIGLHFTRMGDPRKVLSLTHRSLQPPVAGEVRLRMVAAPINPADINFVQGVYGRRPPLNGILDSWSSPCGMEGFGIVEESRFPKLTPGDPVILLSGLGTWSRFMVVPGSQVMRIDPAIPADQAAMLKINPLTALRLLADFVNLQPGDWIVQNAANSGVGRCVIQIARLMGCRTINFVRRQPERIKELCDLGADLVFEDTDRKATKAALAEMGTARPLLAINAVGGSSAANLLAVLAPGGCMVTYGGMSRHGIQVSTSQLVFQDFKLQGFWLSNWMQRAGGSQIRADYAMLERWVVRGSLVQSVDSTYPLREFQSALHRAHDDFRRGRVLFDLMA